ncbi:MAG TPA: hypothetical protein VGB02_03880 [Pyrinomonadaceae bacterium]
MENNAKKRSGKPFDSNQILNRAAKGVFKCLQLRAEHSNHTLFRVILAVPDSKQVRSYLKPISQVLETVAIEVMFVKETEV